MTRDKHAPSLPEFKPALPGFRLDEFLTLTETLLAFPVEQDQVRLDAAPFRLIAPEPLPELPIVPLPPRWYPRPAPEITEAARVALAPPPRPSGQEGRASELERVLRPLLSGHPIRVQGEVGMGKSALLATIASHERTRQRFRRIWWFDHPVRLEQTLALVLNLPHVLAQADPAARRALLAAQFNEHTLLILDHVAADDPLLKGLLALTPHVLAAIDTPPESLDPDQPVPDDPEGVVTLRALDDTAAIEMLAHHAGIEDTRKIRGELLRVAAKLGKCPLALMLAGKLASRDGLSLEELEETLALPSPVKPVAKETPESETEIESDGGLKRAFDLSLGALPGDYRALFEAFGAFPPVGAPLDGLHTAARIGSGLATRRGLIVLAQYGFIRADHRDPQHYAMHPYCYAHAAASDPHGPKNALGKRMRAWALAYVKVHADHPAALYRAETSLLHAHAMETANHPAETRAPLFAALRPYLREVAPELLNGDLTPEPSELTGPRAEGAALTNYGLDLTDQGAHFAAEEALNRALEIRRTHDSAHAIAETLVALGRLHDLSGRTASAVEVLIQAAEMVYNLGAESSLSVIRRGLARAYRHQGRLNEALGVLDDAPEAHLERAAILKAQGNYSAAVAEVAQAADATPYARAELFLLAGRYADALEAMADQGDPASMHLRAQVYHLQGAVEEAIQCYRQALDCCGDDALTRARTLRGLGAGLASAGQYDAAREALESALAIHRSDPTPDRLRLGRTLRLLAAVYLVAGDPVKAAETARGAITQLEKLHTPDEIADAYRTLGRALWQQGDYAEAQAAFEGESEAAQSMADRDDARIGTALHHLADASRATGGLDRAVANYRRALTHKNPSNDPADYFITQVALHRALTEQGRIPTAMDVAEEMLDLLVKTPHADLAKIGYAQGLRARTQHAMQRPIRAGQSLAEWSKTLAARADEAAGDPRPAIRVLVFGLAARSLLAEERPALALDAAERGLDVAEEHFPASLAAWAARRDLGEAYRALDQPEEAILTLEPLLDESIPVPPPTRALAYELSGEAYRALDDLAAALEHLAAALHVEPEAHHRGLIQTAMGDIQLEIGQPAEAVESFRAALPLLQREEHPDIVARVLTTLAHTLGGLNRYAEAIGVYEDALAVLRDVEGVSPVHTADVLRSLGQTHEAQGQLPEAARAYRRALNVLEKADSLRQRRDILHLLARITAAQGDQSAVQLYEQTRDLTREWGDARELGEVLCEMADVHRDAGRLVPAIQNYQAALECQEHPFFARERVNTLRNLGRAYAQMERYDEARAVWTEALDLSRDLPDQSPLETALTHHAIAEAHRSQGHYAEAELSYREALLHHPPGTVAAAATWRALGQTLHAAERYEDAVDPLLRALEVEKSQPQQANARLVQTLQALAATQEARIDLPAAITRHHEALVYMDRRLQPVAYADTLRTLGYLYREDGSYGEAHKALNEALEIEGAHVPRSDERIAATLQAIADTYRDQGDLEKAAEFYQKVTVYANLARRASQELRATLDELERRRETLQAAQHALALTERTGEVDLKNLAFIYALIGRAHASLNQPQESADAIHTLLELLHTRRAALKAEDSDADLRALAALAAAIGAQDTDDLPAAQQACDFALETVRNANLRWVIEQVRRSLE